jgi:hypothetical protein
MGINPLYYFSAPLKGESAAAYWLRMLSLTDSSRKAVIQATLGIVPETLHPNDYRHLLQVFNRNFSACIVPNKDGQRVIQCPSTMSGAEALKRHIARGGFDVRFSEDEALQPAAQPVDPIQQPAEQPVQEEQPAVQQPEQPAAPAAQPVQQQPADIQAALAALAALMPKQGIDEEAVKRIVSDMMPEQQPTLSEDAVRTLIAEMIGAGALYRGIEIREAGKPDIKVEGQFHSKFPHLLRCLKARQSVYLYGPAGTSKTTSARAAATALGLPFVLEVVGLTSTKTDFLGFVDAGGRCTETNFKRAFLNGGVYFIDEADSANANVGIALNTAIENRICAFPDGVFEAHPDFVAVAAGNTNGKGGTAQFGGRVRMDSAFQDRFAFLHWPIDEVFERAITANQSWTAKVQRIRAAVAACGIDDLAVTPRVAIKGERLLAAGFSEAEVLDMLLFRGAVSEEVKTQIFSRI